MNNSMTVQSNTFFSNENHVRSAKLAGAGLLSTATAIALAAIALTLFNTTSYLDFLFPISLIAGTSGTFFVVAFFLFFFSCVRMEGQDEQVEKKSTEKASPIKTFTQNPALCRTQQSCKINTEKFRIN